MPPAPRPPEDGRPCWVRPDDASVEGCRRNRATVCGLFDNGVDRNAAKTPDMGKTMDDKYPDRALNLTGAEIVEACAAFYRYEMHSVRPPPALGVDALAQGVGDAIPSAIDCGGPQARLDRATFSLLDRAAPEVEAVIEVYDALMRETRDTESGPRTAELPRDAYCASKVVCSGKKPSKWRAPRLAYNGAFGPQGGVFNSPPAQALDDECESTEEARTRMVAVVCFYSSHQRNVLPRMVSDMRRRATLAAHLARATAALARAARAARARRAAPAGGRTWSLSSVVASNEGDALGEALLPYMLPDETRALLAADSVLHAWGGQFGRRLKLRLVGTMTVDDVLLPFGDFKYIAHRVEADGSYTMVKDLQIKFNPELYYECMTHLDLPPEQKPPYLLRQMRHRQPKHGSAFDPKRSSVRAYLVRDDAERTPVPSFGRPALVRHDGSARDYVGDALDQCVARFPKGSMPKVAVTTERLSSHYGKQSDAMFRIVVVVDVVTLDAPDDVLCCARHTTETPPFRVISRRESPAAALGSKERMRARSAAERELVRQTREAQAEVDAEHRAAAALEVVALDPDTLFA